MGYTDTVQWIRLTVQPRSDMGALVLRIRPTHIDEIALFEPDRERSGQWKMRITGERTPWIDRGHASVQYGFTVKHAEPTTYYLRLKNTRSSILQIEALEPLEALRSDVLTGLVQWLFLAVMTLILMWAVYDYAQSKERVVAWFALAQALYLLYGVAITGLFAPFLAAATYLPELTVGLVCLAELASLSFHRKLLSLFYPPRWMLRGLDTLILLCVSAMLLCMAGYPRQGLWLNGTIALAAGPIFFLLSLSAQSDVPPGLAALRILYGFLMVSLLVTFAPLLGLLPASSWNLQGGLMQGILGAGMMSTMLFVRSRELRQRGEQARTDLTHTQLQVQLQRARLEEQQHFIAMLTHEIKNPLATIRLTLDMLEVDKARRARIGRAISDIETVVDRCRQVDQLEQGDWPLNVCLTNVESLLRDVIANCKEPSRIRNASQNTDLIVPTDSFLLYVALSNLVENALKYGAPASTVDVHAAFLRQKDEEFLSIAVANQAGAIGLPDPERVFQKYYRSGEALSKSGSGLGLYLVRGIAHRLGGEVSYAALSDSACFTITLPANFAA